MKDQVKVSDTVLTPYRCWPPSAATGPCGRGTGLYTTYRESRPMPVLTLRPTRPAKS
jgi:hypothetical protein